MSAPRGMLERLTKPAIVISLLVAVWTQASAIEVPTITAAAFLLGWMAGRFRPELARRVVLFTTYVAPGAFVAARGRFIEADWVVWVALVCGLMFSGKVSLRWSLPEKWKLPLVYWGVLVAITWPLVTLREADFIPSQLPLFGTWAATVAMGTMVGLLWFDWLFSAYQTADDTALETEILLPLGLGWVLAASIGVYQMFGDMTFLNPGFWANLRRATGVLGDANVFGVLSAIWGPVLVAVASTLAHRWTGWWVAAIGLPLSWLALWASGSRSSLPLALLGLVAVLAGWWRATRLRPAASAAAFAILVIAAVGAVAVARDTLAIGPISRVILDFEPDWSVEWADEMATRLWAREGYGTAAVEMVRRFPLVGVGLSAYYYLARIFSWRLWMRWLPFDNAQNWYRHELAELGALGSLGWIVWTVSFVFLLLTARARPAFLWSGTVVRFVLVGFGLISLVGMPGQSIAVLLTFWTLAFWFLRATATVPTPQSPQAPQAGTPRRSTLAWVALWLLVIGHTAGTAYVGWTALRPPVRAQWAGLDYSFGIDVPRGDPHYEEFHWAARQAAAVLPAPKPWLELTVAVSHLDLQEKPVDVRVWIDRQITLRTRVRTVQPITRYVRVPAGQHIMIETWVSRVIHPEDAGSSGPREQGLLVRWTFVDLPPPNAVLVGQ